MGSVPKVLDPDLEWRLVEDQLGVERESKNPLRRVSPNSPSTPSNETLFPRRVLWSDLTAIVYHVGRLFRTHTVHS